MVFSSKHMNFVEGANQQPLTWIHCIFFETHDFLEGANQQPLSWIHCIFFETHEFLEGANQQPLLWIHCIFFETHEFLKGANQQPLSWIHCISFLWNTWILQRGQTSNPDREYIVLCFEIHEFLKGAMIRVADLPPPESQKKMQQDLWNTWIYKGGKPATLIVNMLHACNDFNKFWDTWVSKRGQINNPYTECVAFCEFPQKAFCEHA